MLRGYRVHILRRDFQSFSTIKIQDPTTFLFQIERGSGARLSECAFSSKNHTSLGRLLQDRTTSRLHFERTQNEGSLRVQP
jgi:hypothetical protein